MSRKKYKPGYAQWGDSPVHVRGLNGKVYRSRKKELEEKKESDITEEEMNNWKNKFGWKQPNKRNRK